MTLPVIWLPEAAEELIEARDWYADIRPELGERFAQAVDMTVNIIAERPSQFQVVSPNEKASRGAAFSLRNLL